MSSSYSPKCISSPDSIQTALRPCRVTTKPTYLSDYHCYLTKHAIESQEWCDAMNIELQALENGTVDRYKAHFVAKGFTQQEVKNEESYKESWAKLRIQLPRVNPDCKEKKQRESVMKPILDDSPLLYSKVFLLLTMHEPCREKGAGNFKVEANFAARRHPLVISCEFVKGNPRLKITLNGINFVDHFLNQGAPSEYKSAETPIGHESNGAVAGE
ncbi:hypothetical protein CK203_039157 [Vitis vinifera]|uniref:Retrotransposon gag domain-containing protein n=1 Tax=Vitis vinifera TaxID=29760 RepID=A0A438H6U6_VITVI|nr:hypothetical protein CK203_039157 [Vitis vinifera]